MSKEEERMEKERKVIRRVLDGDVDAFEELVKAYETKVFNLALQMLGNKQDAQDVSQDAFIKAYKSLSSFRGDGQFWSWLNRIVSNMCLDFLRKRKRFAPASLTAEDDDGDEVQMDLPDTRMSPEQVLEKKMTRDAVRRGLASLSVESRQILLLREIAGLSYEEISITLGLESGTVKSRIFRARKKLKDFLVNDGNIPDHYASKDREEEDDSDEFKK